MYKRYKRIDDRLFIFKLIVYFSFITIIINMLDIFVLNGDTYEDKLKTMVDNIYSYKYSPRGRIYDRSLNLLVDNKMIPILSYINNNDKNSKLIIADYLSDILEIDYRKVTD